MGFSSGGISPNNVDLNSSQTVSNKTLDASNDYSGDIIDPSRSDVKQGTQAELEAYASGASNGQMCFATDTKQMYQVLDSALAAVGGGSGSLDTFLTDTFEVAGVSEYTSGNNAAFDNGGTLVGTLADDTTTNISGTQSLKYTQASGSLNDFIKSPLIPIDKKQQGNTVGLELFYTYSGNDGDLRIVGYDDTGSEVMTIASNTLRAASKAQRFSVQFPVPSGSANLAYGIQVAVENDGAILVIDDVQISTNPYVSKELLDTPVVVRGAGNSGATITAGTERIDFTTVSDDTGSWSNVSGNGTDTFTAPQSGSYIVSGGVLLTGNVNTYLTLYKNSSVEQNGISPSISDDTFSFSRIVELEIGDTVSIRLANTATLSTNSDFNTIHIEKVPTATEHIVAYNSRNAENSMIRLHTGNGYGSTNTKIRRFSTEVSNLGNAITYADSATDGASFTINEDGVYYISHTDGNIAFAGRTGISLNSTQLTTNIELTNTADIIGNVVCVSSNVGECTFSGQLYKGDIVRPHDYGGNDHTTQANFTISKIGVGDLLGVPVSRTAYIKDVKSSGTSGGTFTSGSWQTRDLNTLSGDTEFVSLSSNQFTLEPGKYEIEASAPTYQVNSHKLLLKDISTGVYDKLGSSEYSDTSSASTGKSILKTTIELTNSTSFEIQNRCGSTKSGNGFGVQSAFGVDEIYTQVKIKKVS
jgi:hypothetical protein